MLNNMLGEEDLNRAGFHNWEPNERITSMMAPTLVCKNGKPLLALGTGGANRIRTAILQVICNTIDFRMEPDAAVNSPRVHWEDNTLSLEPGFKIEDYEQIEDFKSFENVLYQKNNMFFGGVHAVYMDPDWKLRGAGDMRREGTVMEC
jgi:gamma-glutamyltranspeptidase/glutathione hydrolase